ncbi:phosphodiester glycosidase family protein [Tindallia californiensis]|uniref:Copper amine oxidase N-terminal domain-containing protein n=1 Tax=Tindallia californiensis TaxID=159292 RepID=A0A1H3K5F8_9FIRM|nr:phosphodiester glycosidase family protein [Tindallia californiensis]SDY46838.1 Copper amine oxidase N-terminal domain-containing protein [Tindallia californiensis]
MKAWKKVLLIASVTGVLLINSLMQPVFASGYLYEDRQKNNIGSGVTHERVLRFGENGWLHMNVVTIDLKNDKSEIDLLQSSQGVSHKETLSQMLTQKENPIAAINTDFFYVTNPDSPLGIMVRDGQVVSSPVTVKPFSALGITKDREAMIDTWQNNMYISSERGGIFSVKAYNKITWNYHQTTIMDRNWGEKSPGASDEYPDLVEIVVKDGQVQEVRRGLPAVTIPENGYVLLASGQEGNELYEAIKPSEKLTFHPQMIPSLEGIELAVGGGTPLVRNGQIASFTEPVTGNHPRTAVGIDNSGSKLLMVTVDGRHTSYRGVNGEVLARLMIEMGSFNALLMDGGGSTTMMVRSPGDAKAALANTPSDGGQRRIINALAVSSASNGYDDLGGIVLEASQDVIFKSNGIALEIKGYDEAYRPVAVDVNQAEFRILEGEGRVESGKLIPDASGKLVVEATYRDKKSQMDFRVIDELAAIQIHTPSYYMNRNDEVKLRVEGIDPDGYRAPLSFEQVSWEDSNQLGSFERSVYKSADRNGVTVLKASYNGHSAAIPMAVGSQDTKLPAFREYTPGFLGYPEQVTGNVSIAGKGKTNNHSIQLDYDLTGSVETTAAYITFGNDYPLPAGTSEIGVWVHAEETAPHWIRAQVQDGSGANHTVDLKQGIDWSGWEYVSGSLPRNLKAPLKLHRLYVVEPDPFFKTSGTLLFDGMEAIAPLSLPTLTAEETGGQVRDRRNRSIEKADKKYAITSDLQVIAGGTTIISKDQSFASAEESDTIFLKLDGHQQGIRQTNYQQWPWLKNKLTNVTAKNIVILMNGPIWGPEGFRDELEAELLNDQLVSLVDSGKNVFVFYSQGSRGTEIREGVRYVGLGKSSEHLMNLYLESKELFYKASDDTSIEIPNEQEEKKEDTEDNKEAIDETKRAVVFWVGQNYYISDNERVDLDAAPYINEDRLMVPVAHVSRALGIPRENVGWDGEKSMAIIETLEGNILQMSIGSSKLYIDGDSIEMGSEAEIRNDRTFVPISRFARAMNVDYIWNPDRQTVSF